jgi:hypothetical protein
MDPAFLDSIVGPLDATYPENETVLAVEGSDGRWLAYPLREVQRAGGVAQAASDGDPLVVLAGPRPDGFTMAAYDPRVEGRPLTLDRGAGGFVDRQTRSRWSIEGVAVEGDLAGTRLRPVRSFQIRWHALVYPHRGTAIWRSPDPLPRYGDHDPALAEPFGPVLEHLAEDGRVVEIEGPVVSQRRPRESAASLTIRVDGHRVNLHLMRSEAAARDYDAFEGAVSGWPVRERAMDFRTRQIGRLVVESDPEERFADQAQVVRLPYRAVTWAPLLDAPVLDTLTPDAVGEDPGGPGFLEVVRALRASGLEVMGIGFLSPGQLRVGCENAIAVTIDGDRFLLYRFESAATSQAYVATEAHARAFDRFAIRSTPETMYTHQQNELAFVGEEWVRWSPILSDPRLVGAMRGVTGETPGPDANGQPDRRDELATTLD